MTPIANNFAILEIPSDASEEQIKQAYRDLAQVWHPDRYQNNARLRAKAEERLKLINAAYQDLCTERKDRNYYRPAATCAPNTPPSTPPPPPQTPPRDTWMPKDPPNGGTYYRRQSSSSAKSQKTPARRSRGADVLRKICIGFVVVLTGLAAVYAKQVIFPKAPATTRSENLAEVRARILLVAQDNDRKFDSLEQWYRRGVRHEEETAYRALLKNAQDQERQLETMIATYNTRKRTETKALGR